MYPANFDYYRAETVAEAISLLGKHEDAKLLAGGHSLLPMMKLRLALPPAVIDIGRIDALHGVTHDGDTLRIGALTTHHKLATCTKLGEHCPIVSEAASHIGDPQVRNKGTLGGSIAHADPASDLPAVLLALDATMHLENADGPRTVAAADFFVDLLETAVGEGDILTAVEVPALGNGGSAYRKFEQPASGYALCGAAAVVRDGKVALAFNGVTTTPHRATAVESALEGSDLSDEAIAAAIAAHLSMEEPMADLHASGEYRVELAKVYGRRAVAAARDRAA